MASGRNPVNVGVAMAMGRTPARLRGTESTPPRSSRRSPGAGIAYPAARVARSRRSRPSCATSILGWYARHGRPLAFRRTRDPYAILVSEAMAQQTQAARAAERWERFMAPVPDGPGARGRDASPTSCASGRASATTGGASTCGGRPARSSTRSRRRVPRDVAALEALPGVGPYTARAVAAIAFGVPVGAVDTNVRRVLGRIVAGDPSIADRARDAGARRRRRPAETPGAWTHALMDLGATVCRAARPTAPAVPPGRGARSRPRGVDRPTNAASRCANAPLRSPPPRVGCAAGSSTGSARPRTTAWVDVRRADREPTTDGAIARRARGADPRRTRRDGDLVTARNARGPSPDGLTLVRLRFAARCPPPSSRRRAGRAARERPVASSTWTCAACAATGPPRPRCRRSPARR